jgi:hypothetical protein
MIATASRVGHHTRKGCCCHDGSSNEKNDTQLVQDLWEPGKAFLNGFRRHFLYLLPAIFVAPFELYERVILPNFVPETWPQHLIVPASAFPWVLGGTALWTAFLTYRDLHKEKSLVLANVNEPESRATSTQILVPQDVYLEFADSDDYKRKLRIEVRTESDRDVIVYAARWVSKTGDIPTVPVPAPGTHPWQIEGAGRELYEVHSMPGQMLRTWVGLEMSAEKADIRRRTVTRRLGTLVVPLRVDGRSIPDQRIEL